ncbi:MAG TPA: sensor histidine kinase [Virgibacillus sp.]|nr:sensor histidine kinase [Virgibacillus sp.]
MKLFLRDHRVLVILHLVQLLTMVSVFWLAGFRNLPVMLYSLFLSVVFLTGYLMYKYMSRREMYKRLTKPIEKLDDSLKPLGHAPMAEALAHLLQAQYNLYHEQMTELSTKQEEHLIFMDRWIHQMKTPLSVIELTADSLDEPESSSVREETDRLKTGLHTVLYMSRLRTIEQDFHIKQVSLYELVQDVTSENKRLFIRHEVYPTIKGDKNIVVESDEKWLYFMMMQLIHNAVKYSTRRANEVIISFYASDGKGVFEIKDFGVGIPKEDLKRIFDAFYTGENGRIFRESTGVGLYLVSEVAKYLGHTLQVSSEVGKGSTFRIVFNV